MVGNFHNLYQHPVRRSPRNFEAFFLEKVPEFVVKLVAVAVAFADLFNPIGLGGPGAWKQLARI
jgi:hypothetical protein